LTGTGPNLVLLGNIEDEKYKGQPLSFGTWIGFGFPQMMLCLILTWSLTHMSIHFILAPKKLDRSAYENELI